MSDKPFLVAARAAVARGYTVFPIRDKQPLTKFVNGDPTRSLASTPEQAEAMSKRFPNATGAGIKLRADQGVFDCDTPAAIQWAKRNLPLTYCVRTGRPGGGMHYYVSLPSRLRHNPRMPVPGLEFKTIGGYVVAPGSIHESGGEYRVRVNAPVAEIPHVLAGRIGPPRPSQDNDATPEERAKWAMLHATRLGADTPFDALARSMAHAAVTDANQWLRHWLPEGDEWGRKFFGQAAHIGVWVGQGLLDFDKMESMLWEIFTDLDDGRGGKKGEAHVRRSIRRGLAAGARNVS